MTADDPNGLPGESMLHIMGSKIRSMRKERRLTVERLSELSGVSTGIVSQLERGKANPSFSTLVQLAHGLGISIARLFETEEHRSPVVRKYERRHIDGHGLAADDGGVYELLTPDLNGALEATWVETPPGYDSSDTPYRHNGEEFGLIISGSKDVYLDGVRHHLEAGDSIRYASTIPHWYVNSGEETCFAVWVITPPTW
ncbi:helix-turn-helix domain-containing protein [Sciscionella marina]|uniref:helix-turn-helix domain-containing protein n=1 Tax=Sciscionella marina TaxID=508770 RepID=UPI0003655B52|nr:cupin domain-containing protein [Sciscionella marina]